ncbi:MAG: phospholipid carrier-dependent glycosyltransferase [Anaerolineae bacterium]|nr:phospholipid carrier-dependent glycosyltransferase [Anaerolineae bacterium]
MKRHTFILLSTIILLGAAFLRIADLHRYPPGMHYDEAADMLLSRDVAWFGYRPFPVVTAYSGREALFYYAAAPLLRIFGTNIMAARLTSAFLGILAVAATIALGKAMTRSRIIALLAGAWMATTWPMVWLSRQGFRTSPQPFLEAMGLWLLWIALRRVRRWMLPAILAGVFSGLTLYVYMAARMFPPWLLIPLVFLVAVDRGKRLFRLRQAVVFVAALAIASAPIVNFYLTNPDVFIDRLKQVLPTENTVSLWDSVIIHLQMFFLRGDPVLRYNVYQGRPYFDPVSGVLLVIGLVIAAGHILKRRPALDKAAGVSWLLCPLLIAPSVVAVGGILPNHMRAVAMVPLIFFLPALALWEIGQWVIQRWDANPHPNPSPIKREGPNADISPFPPRGGRGQGKRGNRPYVKPAVYALSALLIIELGVGTWSAYQFWGGRADLFYENDGDLNAAAIWLERMATPDTLIYIWSNFYEHPTVLAHKVNAEQISWMFDDRLILPPPDREAIYVLPRSVKAQAWMSVLESGRMTDIPLGPDGAPAFQAFQFAAGELTRPAPAVPMNTNVGDILHLRGVDLPSVASGKQADITLYWEVLRAPNRNDLAPIVTLSDAWDNEITREHPYFEDSTHWRPGEWIVQRVRLNVPRGNPPGDYTVKVMWVGKAGSNDYLPLLDEGRFAGIWAAIKPLKVTASESTPITTPTGQQVSPDLYVTNAVLLPDAIQQGEHLHFTVNWLPMQPITSDISICMSAQPTNGASTVLWQGQPVHNTYPMTQWRAGEPVTDRYDVPIPNDLAPGDYRISLALGCDSSPVFALPVRVIEVKRTFVPPSLAHTVDWRFGDSIGLIAYEVQKADDQHVTIKVAWQARAVPDRDYTVFVHLMNPDGSMFSQQDRPPARPISRWVKGEVITETYTLPIPSGNYRITVGLYLQDNGLRLPVQNSAGQIVGDAAELIP